MQSSDLIGQIAPELEISAWLQGTANTLEELRGKVVLVTAFQVNCPGSFLHALPEAAHLHTAYAPMGLHVIGLATAFEDFAINTEDNLRLLVNTGELVGEPLRQLGAAGLTHGNKIDFELPFSIAMDRLSKNHEQVTDDSILNFINQQIDNYAALPTEHQLKIHHQAGDYLRARTHRPHSFEAYRLQGTPSSIVIDRDGILRDVSFGRADHLEALITPLLNG